MYTNIYIYIYIYIYIFIKYYSIHTKYFANQTYNTPYSYRYAT